MVLLRGHLQRPAARRPERIGTGPRGAASWGTRTGPLHLLPELRRRTRVGWPCHPRPVLHDRRRSPHRLGRRRGCALGGGRSPRRAQPLRQGREAPLHLQLDRHRPPGRGGRAGSQPWGACTGGAVRRHWAEFEPGHAGHGGDPDIVRGRSTGRTGPDRHPAGILLPHGRRHLRRDATVRRRSRRSMSHPSRSQAARSIVSLLTCPVRGTWTMRPRCGPGSASTEVACPMVRVGSGSQPWNEQRSRAAGGRRSGPLRAAAGASATFSQWNWPDAQRPAWKPTDGRRKNSGAPNRSGSRSAGWIRKQ